MITWKRFKIGLMRIFIFFILADADEISYKKVYLRDNHAKIDYWQTKWGKMLLDPNINNPNSKVAKLFKVRFRIPFLLFQLYLVPQCEKKNVPQCFFPSL